MRAPAGSRRASAAVNWGKDRSAIAWVGDRPIHVFWPVLAPYFRDVLLPPQRRPDESIVAWTWRSVDDPGTASRAELAVMRRRLGKDQELLEASLSTRGDGRGLVGLAKEEGLAEVMARTVEQLTSLSDPQLAEFTAHTEIGWRLHSWGAGAAAAVEYTSGAAGRAAGPDEGTGGATGEANGSSSESHLSAPGAEAKRRRRFGWWIGGGAAVAGIAVGVFRFAQGDQPAHSRFVDTSGLQVDSGRGDHSARRQLVYAQGGAEPGPGVRGKHEGGPAGSGLVAGVSGSEKVSTTTPTALARRTADAAVEEFESRHVVGSATAALAPAGAPGTAGPFAGETAAVTGAAAAGAVSAGQSSLQAANRDGSSTAATSAAGSPATAGAAAVSEGGGGRSPAPTVFDDTNAESGEAKFAAKSAEARRQPESRAPPNQPPAPADGNDTLPRGAEADTSTGRIRANAESSVGRERQAEDEPSTGEARVSASARPARGPSSSALPTETAGPQPDGSGSAEPEAARSIGVLGNGEPLLSRSWRIHLVNRGVQPIWDSILPTLPVPEPRGPEDRPAQLPLLPEVESSGPAGLRQVVLTEALVLERSAAGTLPAWQGQSRAGPGAWRLQTGNGRAMAEWTGGSRVGEEVVEWVDPVSSTVVARLRRQSPDTLVVEGGADLRVWYRVATKAARPAVPGPLPALNLEWRRRSGLPAPVTWAQGGNAFAEEGRWIEIPLQAGITPGRTSLAAADLDSGWGAAIEIAAELLSPAVGREATPARP